MPTGATPRAADGEKSKGDGESATEGSREYHLDDVVEHWPVCDRCGNDPIERKVTVECAWKNHYLCFWCSELVQKQAKTRSEKAGKAKK